MNEFRIGRRRKHIDELQENLLERRTTIQPSPPVQPSQQLTVAEKEQVAKQVAKIKRGCGEIDELIVELRERIAKRS